MSSDTQTHHAAFLLLGAAAKLYPVREVCCVCVCGVCVCVCCGVCCVVLCVLLYLSPSVPCPAPQNRVLHNIMPIFTFMGDNMLCRDDRYSLQVIQQTVDSVVPVIAQVHPPSSHSSPLTPVTHSPHTCHSQPSHLSSCLASLYPCTHLHREPHSPLALTCPSDGQPACSTQDPPTDTSQGQAHSLPKVHRGYCYRAPDSVC